MKHVIRTWAVMGTVLLLFAAAGCTVRPLMATQAGAAGQQRTDGLSSVAVNPVDTRYAQEVRNRLIFLLRGGGAEPAAPRYTLNLSVSRSVTSAAQVQVGNENEPTAGTVSLTGDYRLTDAATGQVVARSTRQVSASFDRPFQEFAKLRAQRDAEDRAARELAELIRLAVAQDMVRQDAR